MSHYFQLDLNKGQQTHSESENIPKNLNQLKAWIADLPMANVAAMTQKFYLLIHQLNETTIEPEKRLELMETLRDPHAHLQRGLSEKYTNIRLPLSEKNHQLLELNRTILLQMALGYKIMIQDHVTGSATITQKSLLISVERAIYYLGLSLLESYAAYTPVPESVWFELHSLYRYACQGDFHTHHIKDHLLSNESFSIDKLYVRLLIVSAIDPYRLGRGEVTEIFYGITEWANHAKLTSIRPKNGSLGFYLIKLNSDQGPIHASSSLAQPEGFSLYLDCSQLAAEVQDQMGDKGAGGLFSWRKAKCELSKEALSSLSIALGSVSERGTRRTRANTTVLSIVGLNAIYQELVGSGAALTELLESEQPIFQTHDILSLSEQVESQPDVWSFSPKTKRPTSADHLYIELPEHMFSSQPAEKISLQVIDISSSGYCLKIDASLSSKIQVGDLFALSESQQSTPRWKIGAVQWVRQESSEALLMGIKLIHLNPQPVMVKAKKEDGSFSSPVKALFLPEVPAWNQKQALLTDVIPFKRGLPIQLRYDKKVYNLVLGELRMSTRFFVIHEFKSNGGIEAAPPSYRTFNEEQLKKLLSSI